MSFVCDKNNNYLTRSIAELNFYFFHCEMEITSQVIEIVIRYQIQHLVDTTVVEVIDEKLKSFTNQ